MNFSNLIKFLKQNVTDTKHRFELCTTQETDNREHMVTSLLNNAQAPVRGTLESISLEVLAHHLFFSIVHVLKDQLFSTEHEEVELFLAEWFSFKPQDFCRRGIHKLA